VELGGKEYDQKTSDDIKPVDNNRYCPWHYGKQAFMVPA
jgi:hypothetical protein